MRPGQGPYVPGRPFSFTVRQDLADMVVTDAKRQGLTLRAQIEACIEYYYKNNPLKK